MGNLNILGMYVLLYSKSYGMEKEKSSKGKGLWEGEGGGGEKGGRGGSKKMQNAKVNKSWIDILIYIYI